MFPAPLLPTDSRLDGAAMERSGGHLFPNVAVLYAREDSFYKRLSPHVYDIQRDAREREATPPIFAFWLLDLADRCAVGFPSGFLVTPGLSLMGEKK